MVTRRVTAKDCQSCGACCGPVTDEETHADLTEADVRRLPEAFAKRYVLWVWDKYPALRTKRSKVNGVVCGALQGKIGKSVRCSVYEQRPQVCRRFAPGGRECLAARRILQEGV